jgi:tRNA(fMet)-specific endonuclease VapC
MKFLLDTNILVHWVRQQPSLPIILEKLQVFDANNQVLVSIISVGEIKAFAEFNNWGFSKKQLLRRILSNLVIIPIVENAPDVTEVYAEIDAYSQGSLSSRALPKGMSARNMGKNDLWIAATAAISEATLLTADKDFEHLNDVFLNVVTIEI